MTPPSSFDNCFGKAEEPFFDAMSSPALKGHDGLMKPYTDTKALPWRFPRIDGFAMTVMTFSCFFCFSRAIIQIGRRGHDPALQN